MLYVCYLSKLFYLKSISYALKNFLRIIIDYTNEAHSKFT